VCVCGEGRGGERKGNQYCMVLADE